MVFCSGQVALDPETGVLYVSSNKGLSQLGLVPGDPSRTDMQWVQGSALTGIRTTGGAGSNALAGDGRSDAAPAAPAAPASAEGGLSPGGLPIMKPPYGQISAIDLNKGRIIWQVAHGETPEDIRNHPALKGLAIPRTGRTGTVSQVVTKTLVIAGESSFGPSPSGQRGAMLRAYDKQTGKEVGAVPIDTRTSAPPMTFMHNGRQYIVFATGFEMTTALVALALPK